MTKKTASKTTAKAELKAASKISTVVELLRRDVGATLDEVVTATGWLPHTTRAALTGLKKKGHTIEKSRRDDVTTGTGTIEVTTNGRSGPLITALLPKHALAWVDAIREVVRHARSAELAGSLQ